MNTNLDDLLNSEFYWFTGVIEDIADPMELGRVRVRCIGYHGSSIAQTPTSSLPWAMVMMPVTSASMSGIGQSATGLLPGCWVIGFFRDGGSAQDPIVLGTIPSVSWGALASKGFSDPTGEHPTHPGNPDIPIDATHSYTQSPAYAAKTALRRTKIETAVPPSVATVLPDSTEYDYTRATWDNLDPKDVIGPIYPRNNAYRSQSGHLIEIDDTPMKERIGQMHMSGTFRDVVANGDENVTIVGDRYSVTVGSDYVYVKGSVNLTVDGDVRTLVKGNYFLEVEGDKCEYIKGNRISKIGGSDAIEISNDHSLNVGGQSNLLIGSTSNWTFNGASTQKFSGTLTVDAAGNISITAPTVAITGAVTASSTIVAATNVTGGGISLNSHIHGGVLAGGSTTSGPQ